MASFPIVHLEIPANDYKAADKFYADLCGWKIDVDENFDYHQFTPESGPGGGFVKPDGDYKVGDVVVYVGVPDLDVFLKRVVELGGKVLKPKTEIPGIGEFAFFSDPTGNRLAAYRSLNPQGGS
jgi:predicted enzyme related to lactoylglutathione lyase